MKNPNKLGSNFQFRMSHITMEVADDVIDGWP